MLFRLMFPQKPPTRQCHAVFRTKSWRSARPRAVIGFCDTRENTLSCTIKEWNVAILVTVAAVLEQKVRL